MKKNCLILLFVLINSVCTIAQPNFYGVVGGFGSAKSPGSSVSKSYALAGGGVILRGIASPSGVFSAYDISNVSINKSSYGNHKITFKTYDNCTAEYEAYSWILRDATILVNNENSNIYRNVNLLGEPTNNENTYLYPQSKYWYVEIGSSLIDTKSGEMLLLVDILQTNEYYLNKANTNDFNKYVLAMQKFEGSFINWTYNDQHSNFKFSFLCNSNQLTISGRPYFTFLKLNDSETGLVNSVECTHYFNSNYYIIENLNKELFTNAVKFSQIASFYRYLKANRPVIWKEIYNYFNSLPNIEGETPRLIKR